MATTTKMRSQNAMKQWSKHKTEDGGAGKAARRALVEMVSDDAALKRIKGAYEKVVKVIPKGLTISPSPNFNIRLLMVPNFIENNYGPSEYNFQWWLSFNLLP